MTNPTYSKITNSSSSDDENHNEIVQTYVLNDSNEKNNNCYSSVMDILGKCRGICGILACCCCSPYIPVEQGSKGVVLKFGKYDREVYPGLNYINPISEQMRIIDMRLIVIDLARQTVMTADNLTINIDCVLGYKIVNIEKAVFDVKDVQHTLIQFTYTTLRDVIGTKTLQECLGARDRIAVDIKELVSEPAKTWGVEIESMRFKDIHIPEAMQNSLSAAAIATRNAEAKIISAKADVSAAELMRKAADILDSEAAMQIRYLETITQMSKSNNTKVIFLPPANALTSKNSSHLTTQISAQIASSDI